MTVQIMLVLLLLVALCGFTTAHPARKAAPSFHGHASQLAQTLGLHLTLHGQQQDSLAEQTLPEPNKISQYMWAVYVADEIANEHRNGHGGSGADQEQTTRTIASSVLAQQCGTTADSLSIDLTFNISQLREEELSHAEIVFTSEGGMQTTSDTSLTVCSSITGCILCPLEIIGSWTTCRFELNLTKSGQQNMVTFHVNHTTDIGFSGINCPATEGPVLVLHRDYPETREISYVSQVVQRRKRDAQKMDGLLEHVRADRKRRDTQSQEQHRDQRDTQALERLQALKAARNSNLNSDGICQLHNWYVSFEELGWQHVIIAPDGVHANYCFGYCAQIELTTVHNMHAIAIDHYLARNGPTAGGTPPQPQCSPTDWDAMDIMTYRDGMVHLWRVDKMRVSACSCR